jgi:hypothetical protein
MADETDNAAADDAHENMSAQPATEAGAAGASGYVANFDGDEIDGKRYSLGEKIDDNVDPATIAFLVQNGRITPYAPGIDGEPSGGESPIHGPGTGEGNADADALAGDNTKAELLKLAEDEKVDVPADATKAEIAAAIVAKRNAA